MQRRQKLGIKSKNTKNNLYHYSSRKKRAHTQKLRLISTDNADSEYTLDARMRMMYKFNV